MRVGRSIPPAAAPVSLADLLNGVKGLWPGRQETERFEADLKEYFGVRHCFLVSSGKGALTLILQALQELVLGREEVIIPAYTCYSVPAAVTRAGLKIRLCDIDERAIDFDCDQLSSLLEKARPLCLVPAHLYGLPCRMERISEIAVAHGTVVVEDAAQAMGGMGRGKKLGCAGDVGFFSLGRGKALSTVEGGIIVTGRDDIAAHIRRSLEKLPEYGARNAMLIVNGLALNLLLRPSLFWLPKALPFLGLGKTVFDPEFSFLRMSLFQAGVATNWERKLNGFMAARRQLVRRWKGLVEESRFLKSFSVEDSDVLIRFPIRINDKEIREKILDESERSGLGIMPGYPTAINEIGEISHLFNNEHYPVAEKMAEELVTLPVHPLMTSEDVEVIENFIKRW